MVGLRLPAPVARFGRALLDWVYPPVCAGCRRKGSLFCVTCYQAVVAVPQPWCPRCGRPQPQARLCTLCRRQDLVLSSIRATALFIPPLRAVIHQFKYSGQTALARPLGRLMADWWDRHPMRVDALVGVPLHPEREAERGYNQAHLLAEELSWCLDLPIWTGLHRTRNTPPQVMLSWRERQDNVADAFYCGAAPEGRRLLLVDDVCTTGATLRACAIALRRAGAAEVKGLTLARAAGSPTFTQPPDAP